MNEDSLPSAPRQTGSMSAHHDTDIVTRMKNVELIELGRFRIKPWYFSPYPQVRILDSSTSDLSKTSKYFLLYYIHYQLRS